VTQPQHNQIEIVAELAQGFEGNPELARLLVKAAAAAGADAAKFQLVYADELATPDYKYYDLFKTLEMPDAVWEGLAAQALAAGARLYLDIFGRRSLELAERIGVQCVKLHGTDIANAGFLNDVAKSGIPRVMLGAGGANRGEIEKALDILAGKEIVLLLGYQGYPTPTETNQIARVRRVSDLWATADGKVQIGFADHADPEDGTRFALAATAVGAGATVIEKHLTLGRNMKLEDHESALNSDEFGEFTAILRNCVAAFGAAEDTADFGMSEAEYGYRKMIRRHVIAAQDLPAGTVLAPEHVMLKRAGAEDVLTDIEDVYGRTLVQPVAENAPVQAAHLEAR
jgi:sialic acid synthase SpsE